MKELKIFENQNFGMVRVVEKDGEPWFVAKDVCVCLSISNNRDAIVDLDEDEKDVAIADTLGGKQEMITISESGLYSLILRSRKPEAKAFRRWITHEVIPSIRKHGIYATPMTVEKMIADPQMAIELLQALKKEQEANKLLSETVSAQGQLISSYDKIFWEDNAKRVFARSFEVSQGCITVNQLGHMIQQNTGHKTGGKRMFRWMRKNNWICKSPDSCREPTQYAIDKGYLQVRHSQYQTQFGPRTYRQAMVTPKGQQFILNIFLDGRFY